jgi:glycerol-3-phosphate cytidylyltransferase-like family protein
VETLVLGTFDPVTAEHAERLAALGDNLTVAVLESPEPLMPARARAELVAALRCVKQVVLGDPRPGIEAARVIDETAEHAAARDRLVERIRTA